MRRGNLLTSWTRTRSIYALRRWLRRQAFHNNAKFKIGAQKE